MAVQKMVNAGFSGVFRSDNNSKFTLILAEDRPAVYNVNYIDEVIQSFSEKENGAITLLSYAFRSLLNLQSINSVDFTRRTDPPELDKLYLNLTTKLNESKRNILILDDLALFCVQNDRKSKEIYRFFKLLSNVYSQIFIFCCVDTVSKEQISLLCNLAENVVILKNNDVDENCLEFICNHVVIKPSGKTSLNQSCFKVQNGKVVKVERKMAKLENASTSSEDVMKSLTTFKLTIEDSEKESKNRLHLPYLDAQRTIVSDPSEDFYDDDEEDEDD